MSFYYLEDNLKDTYRLKLEREKARKLKKSNWWNIYLQKGICYYCEKKFNRNLLTMDHIVPLSRGGKSTKGNIVPSCKICNTSKKLSTAVEFINK